MSQNIDGALARYKNELPYLPADRCLQCSNCHTGHKGEVAWVFNCTAPKSNVNDPDACVEFIQYERAVE
jgi:hypothetical protein